MNRLICYLTLIAAQFSIAMSHSENTSVSEIFKYFKTEELIDLNKEKPESSNAEKNLKNNTKKTQNIPAAISYAEL